MTHFIHIPLFLLLPALLPAQSCGFSEGKNLAELRAAVYDKTPPAFLKPFLKLPSGPSQPVQPISNLHPLFLPRWSAETLPFFCKIEHDWGKKGRIPFKFRLGSVEYVDWLEGK